MYNAIWDNETGGILLVDGFEADVMDEVRPVFFEELDLLGFDEYWNYPKCTEPLLWAVGRRYYYLGELVAEAEGGGFFEKPKIKFYKKNISLIPVNINLMWQKNERLMNGLIQRAVEFIARVKKRFENRVDAAVVAFSGGKDSTVLLDLVQRALNPDEFFVVFSDTTMELSSTYEAWEVAKKHWNNLRFYKAKNQKDALDTWREFGPPSRICRWCCTVHKSAPNIILLRDILKKNSISIVLFDGVRNSESQRRLGYNDISEGVKHIRQINARPILKWNSAEVYLYIFIRGLFINKGYRYGLSRVGCSVCPFSSEWSNCITWLAFKEDVEKFMNILKDYAAYKGISRDEIEDYISKGGWKSRAGGRDLKNGGIRLIEDEKEDILTFTVLKNSESWLEWIKVIGRPLMEGLNSWSLFLPDKRRLLVSLSEHEEGFEVQIRGLNKSDVILKSRLRSVFNKACYCNHCRSCEVECPTGALRVNGKVSIDQDICIHCHSCISFFSKGCISADSLKLEGSARTLKGLDRYKTFGLEKEWLKNYLSDPNNWWSNPQIGSRQVDSMKNWLKDCEIVENKKITNIGIKIQKLGVEKDITWAILWVNLAKNSPLIKWYTEHASWNSFYSKDDLIEMMGENLSRRTRENAVTSLFNLLEKSPLCNYICSFEEVKEKGRKFKRLYKKPWNDVPPVAILYSLYRYAEAIERHNMTISELYEDAEGGPYRHFGVPREELIKILRGLALSYPDFISINIVKDLDSIFLNKDKTFFEVIELV